ncbi:MAG: GGDEF domain-containing protein, partial [Gammaproteobacteria bacterium]|nr:GGDEF domain-containing protein [Gammaproteobacteria bacterium]
MLNKAEQNTDWKSKYQAALDELDAREREWTEVEDLLRKTITRLSVAGRGIDTRLDKQLRLVHELTREKRDAQLAAALTALTEIIAVLDEDRGGSLSRRSDPILLMLELLQSIHFDKAQRAQLREICSELLKSVAGGQEREQISVYIRQLAALINENFDHPSAKSSAMQVALHLLDLLHLDPDERDALRNLAGDAGDDEEAVLQQLAEQINRRFELPAADGSIEEVLTTLLERLAILQGASGDTQQIRERVQDGVGVGEWATTLNDIVGSISTSLERLNREKRELEDFIRNVTAQLGEITEAITLDHQDHRCDHEDARSLHDFVQEGMCLMQQNFERSNDLQQLKQEISKNIEHIRGGVDDFVDRFNQRHEATEERNLKLTRQLSQMEKETQELQNKLDENRTKLLYDSLTGVYSRMAYEERVLQELSRWTRYQAPFAYAILDIDRFKRINDNYGHSAGDKALKVVAQLMKEYLRQSDYVFRIGGEEFVLLLTNTSAADAAEIVASLRGAIAESSVHFKGDPVQLT